MFNLTIDPPAEAMLLWLKMRDKNTHARIVKALDELEMDGIYHPQISRLEDRDVIYRRRIGRWRIVFTLEPNSEIVAWIIDIEKDTKKDYRKWIIKVKQRKQSRFG